jgi:hypothetical protein
VTPEMMVLTRGKGEEIERKGRYKDNVRKIDES